MRQLDLFPTEILRPQDEGVKRLQERLRRHLWARSTSWAAGSPLQVGE